MADEVHAWSVTIQPGGSAAAPQVFALTMPARIVERLILITPPGPRGAIGWALGAAGQPIIPVERGTFIVTDDDKEDWPLENQIDSGAWQLFAYNLGGNPHTLQVVMLVRVPGLPGTAIAVSAPISAAAITGSVASSSTPAGAAGPISLPELPAIVIPESAGISLPAYVPEQLGPEPAAGGEPLALLPAGPVAPAAAQPPVSVSSADRIAAGAAAAAASQRAEAQFIADYQARALAKVYAPGAPALPNHTQISAAIYADALAAYNAQAGLSAAGKAATPDAATLKALRAAGASV